MGITINDKPLKKPKFKVIKKLYGKYKESRKPEVQLAKIKAKRELLTEKAKLRQQRIGLETQRTKLRRQQLKATGINVPKFVKGTQELGAFASGNGLGFRPLDMSEVLGGQSRKRKGKPYNPFSQF